MEIGMAMKGERVEGEKKGSFENRPNKEALAEQARKYVEESVDNLFKDENFKNKIRISLRDKSEKLKQEGEMEIYDKWKGRLLGDSYSQQSQERERDAMRKRIKLEIEEAIYPPLEKKVLADLLRKHGVTDEEIKILDGLLGEYQNKYVSFKNIFDGTRDLFSKEEIGSEKVLGEKRCDFIKEILNEYSNISVRKIIQERIME